MPTPTIGFRPSPRHESWIGAVIKINPGLSRGAVAARALALATEMAPEKFLSLIPAEPPRVAPESLEKRVEKLEQKLADLLPFLALAPLPASASSLTANDLIKSESDLPAPCQPVASALPAIASSLIINDLIEIKSDLPAPTASALPASASSLIINDLIESESDLPAPTASALPASASSLIINGLIKSDPNVPAAANPATT